MACHHGMLLVWCGIDLVFHWYGLVVCFAICVVLSGFWYGMLFVQNYGMLWCWYGIMLWYFIQYIVNGIVYYGYDTMT